MGQKTFIYAPTPKRWKQKSSPMSVEQRKKLAQALGNQSAKTKREE